MLCALRNTIKLASTSNYLTYLDKIWSPCAGDMGYLIHKIWTLKLFSRNLARDNNSGDEKHWQKQTSYDCIC